MSLLPARTSLFDDLFRDLASGYYIKPLHGDPLPAQIKIDVKEVGNAYQVQAEIPGVPKEDIHVEVHGALVTLRAEVKQQDSQNRDERVLRSERYYGSVSRSFELPTEIDAAETTAKFADGILTLQLPKKQKSPNGNRIRID
ncbi:Hsp20/alpha crystallin family protein [Aquabacterium sp.]|uniref:Hsp20/alpha crystallin family protein n=1 Tax=Aquabacterium sp. TaxID=1872578 RepID=UPI002E379DE1|nr:Hsp20/alpha crystallin family protein [Aquabacterium sp.]HEX5311222.1 Hsp20/alpha crystallin family protein [Aquabacterium sp.]